MYFDCLIGREKIQSSSQKCAACPRQNRKHKDLTRLLSEQLRKRLGASDADVDGMSRTFNAFHAQLKSISYFSVQTFFNCLRVTFPEHPMSRQHSGLKDLSASRSSDVDTKWTTGPSPVDRSLFMERLSREKESLDLACHKNHHQCFLVNDKLYK